MVVLINPFEVPAEVGDEAFLAGWQEAADFLRSQPGFVDATLHRALRPDARFRFVNVATWESPAAFAAAVATDRFRELNRDNSIPNYPALYQVARHVDAAPAPADPVEEGAFA